MGGVQFQLPPFKAEDLKFVIILGAVGSLMLASGWWLGSFAEDERWYASNVSLGVQPSSLQSNGQEIASNIVVPPKTNPYT